MTDSIRRPPGPQPQPLEVRFWRNVEREPSGCWTWTGYIDAGGHPRLRVKRGDRWTDEYAYRIAWEFEHGEPPAGDLPRTCENERCIAPEHRELVSTSESRRRNVLAFWHDAPADEAEKES